MLLRNVTSRPNAWQGYFVTPAQFKKCLRDIGFLPTPLPGVTTRFSREIGEQIQHIARDNVRGGAWRLFLAVGSIPNLWPIYCNGDEATTGWTAAESPWFSYFNDLDPNDPEDSQFHNKEQALTKCFDWLLSVGTTWLTDPTAKSVNEWRQDHCILVKHPM